MGMTTAESRGQDEDACSLSSHQQVPMNKTRG